MSNDKYLVKTADWTMTIDVDSNIFDDPYVEACTRCVEEKLKNLTNGGDFLVNPVMLVKSLKRKNSKDRIINTYKILLNASLPHRAEMLRKVFYMSTQVDLAHEPLSSSKY